MGWGWLIAVLYSSILLAAPARIFGGEEIKPDDPLYQSAPAIIETGQLRCSCVIIEDDIVLTAAHCTPGGPYSLHFSGAIETTGEYRSISAMESHPDYNQNTIEADLAVGIFKGGLPPGYQKMQIAPDDVGQVGDEATLVGFGTSQSAESNSGNGVLRKAPVSTSEINRPTPYIVFDQSKGKGACYGDSGGPAVMFRSGSWFIVGIASYVDPADCSAHSHYTRPSFYLDWMNAAIERLRQNQR